MTRKIVTRSHFFYPLSQITGQLPVVLKGGSFSTYNSECNLKVWYGVVFQKQEFFKLLIDNRL